MKITMELNEEQAELILLSLEQTFRICMGQTIDLAQMLASETYEYNRDDPENERKFNDYLKRRDVIEAILKSACVAAFGVYQTKSSDQCRSISDIWSCLRHELYLAKVNDQGDGDSYDVRGRSPIQLGEYDLPKITVEV